MNLREYFCTLQERENRAAQPLISKWPRTAVVDINNRLHLAFAGCRFQQNPLEVELSTTNQALGNLLANHFVTQMSRKLKGYVITDCKGQGYPDRCLVSSMSHKSYPFELKSTCAFDPQSTQRVILTCSSWKLRRFFVRPVNHILIMLLYERIREKVRIVDYRSDFLEPHTKVNARFEASLSKHLLSKANHMHFCGPLMGGSGNWGEIE